MTERLSINQIVDATPARVVVTRDSAGVVKEAAFDMSGLPRVDALLTGRPVVEVPGLVERLCSICPSAHHLAGMRALEGLAGYPFLTPTAEAVRRLLHHAGVISIHVMGLVTTDPEEALLLRRFAKSAMAAAGSPSHFPVTAVPGGVIAPVDPAQRDACMALVPEALAAAERIAVRAMESQEFVPDPFAGAELALVDAAGHLDLFGAHLKIVTRDGTTVTKTANPWNWDQLVAEADPGSPAPKPYLLALGSEGGSYRVGPVAQLHAARTRTPVAMGLQDRWLSRDGGASAGGALAARGIITVHCVEVIAGLLKAPELVAGEVRVDLPALPAGVGIGWVDGARGLLVHRYETTGDGRVKKATILTPTAQNEPWLGSLLKQAGDRAGLEQAIHEADPCLPCSTAPAGAMDLVVDTIPA